MIMFLKTLRLIEERTRVDAFKNEYKQTRANKYNPLTYLWVGCLIPLSIFCYGWKETKTETKKMFDWR